MAKSKNTDKADTPEELDALNQVGGDEDSEKEVAEDTTQGGAGPDLPKKKDLGSVTPLEVSKKESLREEAREFSSKGGFVPITENILASKYRFYPDGAHMSARPAGKEEIKNWSLLDNSDITDIEVHIQDIINSCVRFNLGEGRSGSYKDIVEMDRYPILFFIRDLTMREKDKEKKIFHSSTCQTCGEFKKKEITSLTFSRFTFPKWLEKYYEDSIKGFHVLMEDEGVDLKIYIPTMGVSREVKNLIQKLEIEKQRDPTVYYNADFVVKYYAFMTRSYKDVSKKHLEAMTKKFADMNENTRIALAEVSSFLSQQTASKVMVSCDKAENVTEEGERYCYQSTVRFQDGFRSLFDFSDISSKLFSDSK